MKKKELMRRLSAISIAAMVTVTTVPSTAFAADIEFSDEVQETTEDADAEVDAVQEDDTDDAGVLTGQLSEDELSDAGTGAVDADIVLFSDNADEGTENGTDADAKAAAAAYLKTNYVDGTNKIFTTGADSSVKSADGLSYSVGLKTPSGYDLESLRLKAETSSTRTYESGWYISKDCEWVFFTSSSVPLSIGKLGINRPTAEQGDQSFKATLRLFAKGTDSAVINNEETAAQEALAEQEFTITIEAAEPNYTMTVKVQDEDGNPITDATVTLEKNYSTVSPKEDGSYDMEKGAEYTLTVKKDGYNDYKESYFTFNPTEVNTVKTVTLKKIVTRNVRFNVTDKSGNPVNGATVTVKKGWYDTIKPEEDGSYNLIDGTTYKYTVEAPNYKSVSNQEFTPDKDDTINVQLEKNISNYTVTINPVDKDSKAIENASIKVTYEEEDPWDEDETETVELKANDNGTYTMQKGVTYTYTVTAPDYKDVTDTYTPSGDNETISLNVKMVSSIDPADVATVNAIKTEFDAEKSGALRPNFATDKNICEFVKARIGTYTDIDTTGVTVSVKSTDNPDVVAADGTINYRKQAPDQYGINFQNVALVYVIEKNGAKAETKSRNATIGWDRDYFNAQMATDKENLTWDKIKGSNTDAAEVTSDLTLPQCLSTSAKTAWSSITWTSSNENVISFKDTGYGSLIDAKTGVVTQQPEDTEVTLTATFIANENTLNTNVEKVSDFATLTKEFKVTVKGTGETGPTEEELKAILDKYYTADQIEEFGTDNKADLKNCTYDLQLPKHSRIEDENGESVFTYKEIVVTSDNPAITINGYKANVDRFASDEDLTVNLIVTFTRDDVTVSKKIPVTIKPVTEAEVQDQLDLMDYAKEHYFDGINDGQYADKDSITGNLHAFQELQTDADGKYVWVYDVKDMNNKGIVPDDLPDSDEMGTSGFRLFKSSNNAVVQHENLVVTRREDDTEIIISSVLSSELYKDAAAKHPDNKVLQKLYKQPVSVTVTIKGTKAAIKALPDKITEAQELLDSITEGTEPGQYKEGTKDALQAAIDKAAETSKNEELTEDAASAALKDLNAAIKAAKEAQNATVARVTINANLTANEAGTSSSIEVRSDAAAAYGFIKPEAVKNQVTVADALYTLHAAMYGEEFSRNPEDYLEIGSNGWINAAFGVKTSAVGYLINNAFSLDMANVVLLKDGDKLNIFFYGDTTNYSDRYLYFENVPTSVETGKEFTVTVMGADYTVNTVEKDCTVALKNLDTAETVTAKTDANGKATFKADKAGKYQLTVTATPYEYYVVPTAQLEVKASATDTKHDHNYTWKTISEATVFEAEKQQGICSICGATVTRDNGTKLTATIKLNAKSIKLQKKQTTKKIRVTMANGDSVKSWTSSNKKIVTVNKKGVIKAGKKTGTAKITVTLKSGKKAALKVKVQKARVKTTKISGLKSKVVLNKGKKLALKPVISPLTSQDKVTYTSSNKKVATVNKNGVITAKKKGTAKIKVKSGKKIYTIKVTVK